MRTDPPSALMPAVSAEMSAAVLAEFRELARAAPRLWAWEPGGGLLTRVSGRPPADGRPTDTAFVLGQHLARVHGPGCLPRLEPALRRALRPDGSLPSTAVLRALADAGPVAGHH